MQRKRCGSLRTSSIAARVLASELPVITMRVTPAASARSDHVRAIVVEAVVGEVDADVDELGARQWGESASGQPVLSFEP